MAAVFKNVTDHPVDVPLFNLRLQPGDTFEVPDEAAYSFENNPMFESSRSKHPTTVADPDLVASTTGSIPIVPPAEPVSVNLTISDLPRR